MNNLNKKIRFTAVICTFNGWSKGYLAAALDSVFDQTLQPEQIVLVDDGSTDNTALIVKERYPKVEVISQKNRGLPAARNKGIEAAQTNWVAFLDDDDIWLPDKLKKQAEQISVTENSNLVIFASRMSIISEADTIGRPVSPLQFNLTWPTTLICCPVTGPSGVIISKSLWRLVGPFNERLTIGEDFEYWARASSLGAPILYSDEILFHYRRHNAQMTSAQNLLKTLLKSEEAVFTLTTSLGKKNSQFIRWIRFFRGLRTLLIKRKIFGLISFVISFPIPSINGSLSAASFVLCESFCKLFPSKSGDKITYQLLSWHLK